MSDPPAKKSSLAGAGWGVLIFVFNLVVPIVVGANLSPNLALVTLALLPLTELCLAIAWRSSHNLRSRALFFALAFTAVVIVLLGLALGACLLLLKDFHG